MALPYYKDFRPYKYDTSSDGLFRKYKLFKLGIGETDIQYLHIDRISKFLSHDKNYKINDHILYIDSVIIDECYSLNICELYNLSKLILDDILEFDSNIIITHISRLYDEPIY